jgi:hypothetical protein
MRIEVEAEGEVLELELSVLGTQTECSTDCQIIGQRLRLSNGFPSEGHRLAVTIATADGGRGPAAATVRVFRGGMLAAEGTFEPRYQTDEPNGRGGGEHVHASASLVVP